MLTCPAKHLVHDRLDEEDEEEPDAEEQLGERIFQLQQCRRHHPHVGGTFQGLPHLFSKIFSSSSNKSSTSPSMWMNTVEMRTPPPKHKTMPEKRKIASAPSLRIVKSLEIGRRAISKELGCTKQ